MIQGLRHVAAELLLWLAVVASSKDSLHIFWLGDLNQSYVRQGWGAATSDRSVEHNPLRIGTFTFGQGVGTHAPSAAWIRLDGRCEHFSALVGVDSEVDTNGSVVFVVVADGKKNFQSPVMRGRDPPEPVELDLRGVRLLGLMVEDAGDGMAFDHADWASAHFMVTGKDPEIIPAPPEDRTILTPPEPESPRINGPGLFGVRPGSPFLFRVPVSGRKPVRLRARGLPKGLTVDKKSGIITGTIASQEKRLYPVHVRVRNRKGRDHRMLTIMVGDTLALTPPMGWNSWCAFRHEVTDSLVRAVADAMVSTGLADHGYSYLVIDDGWSCPLPDVAPQRQCEIPVPESGSPILTNHRFPDMRSLTGYIHGKGLKAGIYSSPGPGTCGGYMGSFGHEEADAGLFASWGFDFLKYDLCTYTVPGNTVEEHRKPYALMGGFLGKQGRDILLNICQYGHANVSEWGRSAGGHLWRVSQDVIVDIHRMPVTVFDIGFGTIGRERFSGPGGWNDYDMVGIGPLIDAWGKTVPVPLTANEQYAYFSLWCLKGGPLFISSDVTKMDEFTIRLLSNDEVIAVNQDHPATEGRRVAGTPAKPVWSKPMSDGSLAVGLFNRGEYDDSVSVSWNELGISGTRFVRDLWRRQDLGETDGAFTALVPRRGVVLVRLSAEKPSSHR